MRIHLNNTVCHLVTLSDGERDVSWQEPATEITHLPDFPSARTTAFDLLIYIHEKDLVEFVPNLWVALRIACTLPVILSSAEEFFKSKTPKNISSFVYDSRPPERLSNNQY